LLSAIISWGIVGSRLKEFEVEAGCVSLVSPVLTAAMILLKHHHQCMPLHDRGSAAIVSKST
jgi:hypothetical protein